jgi:hypothetical protein
MHMALKIPYHHDYIKIMQEAGVSQPELHVRASGQGEEAMHRKQKGLK